jgi:S1-C subfamily serine protease
MVYEWRRTLLTPMFVHFLQNLTVGLLTLAVAVQAANAPLLGILGIGDKDGCLLKEVDAGSAAAEAGLQPNDIITSIDGYGVRDVPDLAAVLYYKRAGDKVVVEFLRDKKKQRVEVLLKPR